MAEYSDSEAAAAEEWRSKKLRCVDYADFDGMVDNGNG